MIDESSCKLSSKVFPGKVRTVNLISTSDESGSSFFRNLPFASRSAMTFFLGVFELSVVDCVDADASSMIDSTGPSRGE